MSALENKGEIVLYQPDNAVKLEVRLEDETVWLSLNQIADLFERDKSVISRHIKNIFKEKELFKDSTVANFATVQIEGGRTIERDVEYYNLDVIISVGYRVKSQRGIQFRQWANRVLKEYLLKGYAINQRIERVEKFAIETEKRVTESEHRITDTEKKIDFFVKTSLPPVEGIFYDGQIFDAYTFAADLVKSAAKSVTLIDNYVDESVLLLLSKRRKGVNATVYTAQISSQLQLDLQKHNAQYPAITVKTFSNAHDRFLFIDNNVYHIGASLKDLGKKWFAFTRMQLKAPALLKNIAGAS